MIYVLIFCSIGLALNVVATVQGFSPFWIMSLEHFGGPLAKHCSSDKRSG